MYTKLAKFYQKEIFTCTRCRQKLINPYIHANPKHDPPDQSLAANRRKFQLDYIASKKDVRIVVIGEAPGLDGCGYGGIAFTGEYNAVKDLGLTNYHGTQSGWQKEQSANLLYGALGTYCQRAGVELTAAAGRMYFTNAIMCVPLGENGRSITAPAAATRLKCQANLRRQIEILQPRLLLTLGANALKAVADTFGLQFADKLTILVQNQRRSRQPLSIKDGLFLIPEIHPSPRNRVLGQIYTDLPASLTEIFFSYLRGDTGIIA
jgi:uracil-DNA glycosylase